MSDVAFYEEPLEAAPFDPEMGLEVEQELPEEEAEPARVQLDIMAINLAEGMDENALARLGRKVVEEYEIDCESRKSSGWQERHDAALKLAMQVKEAKNYPWPNAANVKYPLITVAAIQFAARAYPAIVDGANVAKAKVMGRVTPEKQARADRIGRHMSYQLLDEMDEWEEGTDELLHILPCTGTVHRKTYFDPMKGRNCSEIVTADKLIVNYWAKADAPRMTQVCEFYPHEIIAKKRAGIWLDVELGLAPESDGDDDAPHVFLEQHRLWDLDEDGYPEPYIVTVHQETGKVVRIYARYDEQGMQINSRGEIFAIEPVRYFTRYRFMPSLDGSYYGMGFGTLLDALNETINSTINQLLDAGHLSNVQGGFIGSGVSLKSGNHPFRPGEWKKAENAGGTLRDNIVPLPVREPSNVLFNLLGMLIEASKDITATKDILTGETSQSNQPVGTTLAQIEQGLKVFSAIYKRIHRSLKMELQALFRLNAIYLDPQVYFTFQDEEGAVAQEDYRQGDLDIIPVSDPTVVTDMQRIGRAQFLMQFRSDPLMNGAEINKRVLEAASIDDVKSLFAPPQEGPPPEVQIKMKEFEQKDRELNQKDEELRIRAAESDATIAQKISAAQKQTLEAFMMAPEFQDIIADFVDTRVAMTRAQAGEPNGPPLQQPDVRGMGQPPPDAGVPGLPPGQPEQVGGPMEMGPGNGPGPAVQGPPDGGVGEPFV